MAFSLSTEHTARWKELSTRYPTKRALCIPLLQLCQAQEGWMSPDVIDFVAEALDLSTSEVKGVATFYTSLHDRPMGKHVVWVCRTLSCELRGAKALQQAVERHTGCAAGKTSADGKFTLLKAECLAGCGYAPVMQVDDRYFENLSPEDVPGILDQVSDGRIATRLLPTGANVGDKAEAGVRVGPGAQEKQQVQASTPGDAGL